MFLFFSMDEQYALKILTQNKKNYNKIAQEFSGTRGGPWKDLTILFEYITPNDKVLDLGCGNGRLYPIMKDKGAQYIGVDNSEGLISIAKRKHPEASFQVADALKLPFKDNSFDKIYAIAVLHHIPSKELREQFLKQARRVLKPNGLLIITVWKLARMKRVKLLFKFSVLKIIGRTKLDFGDILVPWASAIQRYVHQYTKQGLKKDLKIAGFNIQKTGFLKWPQRKDANIYIVAKKR